MQSIPEWFAGKNIFITGATGFMGKILVEKILRSCPDVGGIYILVRPKRNRSPKQRLDDFFKQPIFEYLRNDPDKKQVLEKLKCICGDVTKENITYEPEDNLFLKQNIDVVFHMAANVRFDQPLKEALQMNTGGTLRILELATGMKRLKSFVHVSTTYCHCDETILEERVYPAPHDPRKMLDLIKWLDEDIIVDMTPKLLGNSPNTYAYTKCLTEQLVTSYSNVLPIAIARPSIVIACYKDPIPGWVDNINGPTGILIGAGKGIIRSMHCNDELIADFVPVDVAINSLIIIAKELGSTPEKTEPLVVNLATGKDNPVSWGEALALGKKHFFNNPFTVALWYPEGSPKKNYFHHMLCVIFLHYLPAYIIDFILPVFGHKKFLVRTQKRISCGLKVLQYYTTRAWEFKNDRLKEMVAKLNESDTETFYASIGDIKWDDFMLNYILGARKYCMKEDPETIPKARRLMSQLYILHILVKIVFCVFFLAFTSKILLAFGVVEN